MAAGLPSAEIRGAGSERSAESVSGKTLAKFGEITSKALNGVKDAGEKGKLLWDAFGRSSVSSAVKGAALGAAIGLSVTGGLSGSPVNAESRHSTEQAGKPTQMPGSVYKDGKLQSWTVSGPTLGLPLGIDFEEQYNKLQARQKLAPSVPMPEQASREGTEQATRQEDMRILRDTLLIDGHLSPEAATKMAASLQIRDSLVVERNNKGEPIRFSVPNIQGVNEGAPVFDLVISKGPDGKVNSVDIWAQIDNQGGLLKDNARPGLPKNQLRSILSKMVSGGLPRDATEHNLESGNDSAVAFNRRLVGGNISEYRSGRLNTQGYLAVRTEYVSNPTSK